MNEEIRYHVWKVDISREVAETLGFTWRGDYYDKTVESQMDKHYIKIFCE